MADISTSMYPQAPAAVQPMNPFTAMSQAAGITSALNRNRLFQQEFADRAAMNQLYSQTPIDPETGMPDTRALMSGAQGLNMGRLMPQLQQQIQQQRQQQLGISGAELEQAIKRNKTMMELMSPLVMDKNLTAKTLQDRILDVGRQFNIPAQAVAQRIMQIPAGASPEDLQKFVSMNYLFPAMDSQRQMEMAYGSIQQQDIGGSIQTRAVSPVTGIRTLGETQKTLSPGEREQRIPAMVPGPGGTMVPVTMPLAMAKGQTLQTAPALNQFGLSPTEAAARVTYKDDQGREHTVTLNDFLSKRAGGEGGGTVGPTPAAQAASTKIGGDSAEAMSQHLALVKGSAARLQGLEEADRLLNNIQTGRGTESVNAMKSYLLGIPGLRGLADEIKVADYDKLNKYLSRAITDRASTFGKGTDMQLGSVVAGSPNVNMQTMANRDLVKVNIGLERMDQALAQAASLANVKPEDFSKFAADWATKIDPRAFIVGVLTPDKADKLKMQIKKESNTKRMKFVNSYDQIVVPLGYGIAQGTQ